MDPTPERVAGSLRVSIGLLRRKLRALPLADQGELTFPETAALARLERGGATTPGELARQEQISPQSMGATLGGLENRGLVERVRDRSDGRRWIMSITDDGSAALADRRDARVRVLAEVLASE